MNRKTPRGWLDAAPLTETLAILDNLSMAHAKKGGPVGQKIALLIEQRDYASLVDFELCYHWDWDVFQLIQCRQALAFYQKCEPLEIGVDKTLSAWVSFEVAEHHCRETNAFFRDLSNGTVNLLPPDARVFYAARRKIARILGRVPRVDQLPVKFGPGATTTIKRGQANPQQKLAEAPTCSALLYHSLYMQPLVASMPHWLAEHAVDKYEASPEYTVYEAEFRISPSRLQFVPKNAKTYRSIDTQPTLNTMLQMGIGTYMTQRLARYQIDISDQVPNQQLAREGSISQKLATIDLQSASDTISKELVRFLLPDEWYALLRAASCGVTEHRGQLIHLDKFSAMGNGFTFPLETLIFWALVASVCEDEVDQVRAYGDDIICPVTRYDEVVHILEVAGFTVNKRKSFHTGPFRESCGADWYFGIDIRPYYQKTLVTFETLFTLHNFYHRHGDTEQCEMVLGMIPDHLKRFGPDGYGDGHLLSRDWDLRTRRSERRRGFSGGYFRTFKRVGLSVPSLYPGDYVTPLYSIYVRGEPNILNPCEGQNYEYMRGGKPGGRPVYPVPGSDSSAWEEVSIYTFCLSSRTA